MLYFPRSSYLLLPEEPGVYLFLDNKGLVLYVGKAKNLKNRVSSYFVKNTGIGEKTKLLIEKIDRIAVVIVASEVESLLLEANYIKKYSPPYNIRLTDGKAYPLIRITIQDEYPAVLIARREEDTNSVYFGPYPNPGALRLVLKTIRRIFPFQSALHHSNKLCLYYHLGLCPCPNVNKSKESKKTYKKQIKRIIYFLSGNIKKVVKDLEEERNQLSKNEQFEEAKKIQQKVDAIYLITSPVHKPFEYEVNPNLQVDIRQKELNSLLTVLQEKQIQVTSLNRIECFDISNTQGTNSVGSMVVFVNGEKQSSLYRRFKISNNIVGPNDFKSMEEVLKRRVKHEEWGMPDLLVVDGGKGQVSSAKKALTTLQKKIPFIGLAKREETIITSDLQEISLSKDTPGLKLLMRIRNEAHRFAITYHRKLRSKSAIAKSMSI